MTTQKVLRGAIALLKKGWTKGVWARNPAGQECSATDEHATAWCAQGATIAASKGASATQWKAWKRFCKAVGVEPYVGGTAWNDGQKSVKPVIAGMKRAQGKRS